MNPLIHQCPTAVECQRAAPFRTGVVFWRTVPFDCGLDQNGTAELSRIDPLLHAQNVGLEAILKENSEAYAGAACCSDQSIGSLNGHIDRLFCEHMQAALR